MANEKRNFKKVEESIFKFEKPKDEIEGIFLSRESGINYNNEVYKIKQDDGKIFTIFSTRVLETQMKNVSLGDYIKIVFTGAKKAEKKGYEDTKLFEVFKAD